MIRLRLSNGYSFASEFEVDSPLELRKKLSNAFTQCVQNGCSRPEIHVCTEVKNEWISINYPRSNANATVATGVINTDLAEELFIRAASACNSGTYLDKWLNAKTAELTKTVLRVVE